MFLDGGHYTLGSDALMLLHWICTGGRCLEMLKSLTESILA